MSRRRYVDCIRDALREEMARDAEVFVLGEDVTLGGPFGATRGLADEFGEERVVNTPISESTVTGIAVGAATMGARPVVEIMFCDFITLAMDQLVNHAAKLRFMTGGALSVPMTVRVQFGVDGAYGAHHSQSLEAWLAHVPGLKVVMPASPADAKGLLKAAIRDDDPVVYLEHRALYFTSGEVPDGDVVVPLGSAAVVRPGADVTILATSRMVSVASVAAEALAADGIEAEVIDLRSLTPLDFETIQSSVAKTNRALVLHEAVRRGGFGGELAAEIQARCFDYLDAPVLRLGGPFAPVSASPALEREFVPSAERVVKTARSLVLKAGVA